MRDTQTDRQTDRPAGDSGRLVSGKGRNLPERSEGLSPLRRAEVRSSSLRSGERGGCPLRAGGNVCVCAGVYPSSAVRREWPLSFPQERREAGMGSHQERRMVEMSSPLPSGVACGGDGPSFPLRSGVRRECPLLSPQERRVVGMAPLLSPQERSVVAVAPPFPSGAPCGGNGPFPPLRSGVRREWAPVRSGMRGWCPLRGGMRRERVYLCVCLS